MAKFQEVETPRRYSLRHLISSVPLSWRWRLVSLLTLLALWEYRGRTDQTLLFPPFTKVVAAFWDLILSGELVAGFAISLQAFALGFGLAVIAGVLTGLGMGRIRLFEQFITPYVDILLASPPIAFIPLFVVWFGLGLTSRVGVVFTFAYALIAINTYAGVRGVDPQLVEMGRAFGLPELQLFRKIILPGALPLIMSGIRLGAAQAFIGMVAADIILVSVGIGGLLQYFNVTLRTASLFATVSAILLLAVGLIELTRAIENRVASWRDTDDGHPVGAA